MRGQVSIEYLLIIGFAFGILLPSIFMYYKYAQTAESGSESTQFNEIGIQSVAAVRSTYALGIRARETLDFTMPDSIINVTIGPNNEELIFVYDTPNGISESVVFTSNIDMITPACPPNPFPCEIPVHPGKTSWLFVSEGRKVMISEAP